MISAVAALIARIFEHPPETAPLQSAAELISAARSGHLQVDDPSITPEMLHLCKKQGYISIESEGWGGDVLVVPTTAGLAHAEAQRYARSN